MVINILHSIGAKLLYYFKLLFMAIKNLILRQEAKEQVYIQDIVLKVFEAQPQDYQPMDSSSSIVVNSNGNISTEDGENMEDTGRVYMFVDITYTNGDKETKQLNLDPDVGSDRIEVSHNCFINIFMNLQNGGTIFDTSKWPLISDTNSDDPYRLIGVPAASGNNTYYNMYVASQDISPDYGDPEVDSNIIEIYQWVKVQEDLTITALNISALEAQSYDTSPYNTEEAQLQIDSSGIINDSSGDSMEDQGYVYFKCKITYSDNSIEYQQIKLSNFNSNISAKNGELIKINFAIYPTGIKPTEYPIVLDNQSQDGGAKGVINSSTTEVKYYAMNASWSKDGGSIISNFIVISQQPAEVNITDYPYINNCAYSLIWDATSNFIEGHRIDSEENINIKNVETSTGGITLQVEATYKENGIDKTETLTATNIQVIESNYTYNKDDYNSPLFHQYTNQNSMYCFTTILEHPAAFTNIVGSNLNKKFKVQGQCTVHSNVTNKDYTFTVFFFRLGYYTCLYTASYDTKRLRQIHNESGNDFYTKVNFDIANYIGNKDGTYVSIGSGVLKERVYLCASLTATSAEVSNKGYNNSWIIKMPLAPHISYSGNDITVRVGLNIDNDTVRYITSNQYAADVNNPIVANDINHAHVGSLLLSNYYLWQQTGDNKIVSFQSQFNCQSLVEFHMTNRATITLYNN